MNLIIENVKEFHKVVGEKLKRFDKFEKAHYLSLLIKTTYDTVGDVREHATKMVNWCNKLKSMNVEFRRELTLLSSKVTF